jgi:hypothetical protein
LFRAQLGRLVELRPSVTQDGMKNSAQQALTTRLRASAFKSTTRLQQAAVGKAHRKGMHCTSCMQQHYWKLVVKFNLAPACEAVVMMCATLQPRQARRAPLTIIPLLPYYSADHGVRSPSSFPIIMFVHSGAMRSIHAQRLPQCSRGSVGCMSALKHDNDAAFFVIIFAKLMSASVVPVLQNPPVGEAALARCIHYQPRNATQLLVHSCRKGSRRCSRSSGLRK